MHYHFNDIIIVKKKVHFTCRPSKSGMEIIISIWNGVSIVVLNFLRNSECTEWHQTSRSIVAKTKLICFVCVSEWSVYVCVHMCVCMYMCELCIKWMI